MTTISLHWRSVERGGNIPRNASVRRRRLPWRCFVCGAPGVQAPSRNLHEPTRSQMAKTPEIWATNGQHRGALEQTWAKRPSFATKVGELFGCCRGAKKTILSSHGAKAVQSGEFWHINGHNARTLFGAQPHCPRLGRQIAQITEVWGGNGQIARGLPRTTTNYSSCVTKTAKPLECWRPKDQIERFLARSWQTPEWPNRPSFGAIGRRFCGMPWAKRRCLAPPAVGGAPGNPAPT